MIRFAGFGGASAICIADMSRAIRYTNSIHLDMLGRSRDEVIGADWQSWMAAEDAAAIEPLVRALWRTRSPYDVVTQIVRGDGAVIPIVARCSLIEGETKRQDLLFAELQTVERLIRTPPSDRFACASFVRDLTYELAHQTGRNRLGDLTNALVAASASAERAVEMLATAAETIDA